MLTTLPNQMQFIYIVSWRGLTFPTSLLFTNAIQVLIVPIFIFNNKIHLLRCSASLKSTSNVDNRITLIVSIVESLCTFFRSLPMCSSSFHILFDSMFLSFFLNIPISNWIRISFWCCVSNGVSFVHKGINKLNFEELFSVEQNSSYFVVVYINTIDEKDLEFYGNSQWERILELCRRVTRNVVNMFHGEVLNLLNFNGSKALSGRTQMASRLERRKKRDRHNKPFLNDAGDPKFNKIIIRSNNPWWIKRKIIIY